MKNILLITAILLTNLITAQTVTYEYSYDAAGNRYKRIVIEITEETTEDSTEFMTEKSGIVEESEEINDEKTGATISVFPNPATAYLNIQISDIENSASYQLYSINGSVVKSGTISSNTERIELFDLEIGTYLLRIENGKSFEEFKIIKR